MMHFFKKEPKPPEPTGKIIKAWEHRGWGNHIGIFDWEKQKLYGHLPFKLHVGDTILLHMTSGKIGEVRISEVKNELDPPDMFFATFWPIGYYGEKDV